MITFTQIEDRALELGKQLEVLLLSHCLENAGREDQAQLTPHCPQCRQPAARTEACVCDGQASNWTVWERHLKPRVFIPILDFIHLLTYISGSGKGRRSRVQYRHTTAPLLDFSTHLMLIVQNMIAFDCIDM